MKYFLAENWEDILKYNGLDSFEKLWGLDLEKVDRPNIGHGGWSAVTRLMVNRPGKDPVAVYVKRQENYRFRSLVFPLVKIMSFDREMRRFIQLSEKGIPVSSPVYYEKKRMDGKRRAILMIESLEGYRDLNQCLKELGSSKRPFKKKQRLIEATADVIRRLHDTGYQHGMLFGKHIFIRGNGDYSRIDVRLIDLEFVRWHPNRVAKDLTKLYKRVMRVMPDLPAHDYIRFVRSYRREALLSPKTRRIISAIKKRIEKKNRKKQKTSRR